MWRNRIRNAKRYGIRVFWDKEYRAKVIRKAKNRKRTLADRKRWGGSGRASPESKRKLKIRLFKILGNKCFWCRGRMFLNTSTIDHIVPSSHGGNSKHSNLRLIHNSCRVERDRMINKGTLTI